MAGNRLLKLYKVAEEPGALTPDSVYIIKKPGDTGFDIKVSDAGGGVLYAMNCCADGGGSNPGGGGTTTLPYKSYTAIFLQRDQRPPTLAIELQNDFEGATPQTIYNEPGMYSIIMPGVFTERTLVFCNAMDTDMVKPRIAAGRYTEGSEIQISCGQDNNIIQLDVRIYG
jgi:hypothetical protein